MGGIKEFEIIIKELVMSKMKTTEPLTKKPKTKSKTLSFAKKIMLFALMCFFEKFKLRMLWITNFVFKKNDSLTLRKYQLKAEVLFFSYEFEVNIDSFLCNKRELEAGKEA